MKLVHNWNDIRHNLITLDHYQSSRDDKFRQFFYQIICRGVCFVVYQVSGRTLFGPSRFIGYLNNTREKHLFNIRKSGLETNPQIEHILHSRFLFNQWHESIFLNFCQHRQIVPKDNRRKYIFFGGELMPDENVLIQNDIDEISKNKKLKETEKRQLIQARIGQGLFRLRLLRYWKSCAVTGCRTKILLRASHIKPWHVCTNSERLDPFNGLLLVPSIDLAFDIGLISFNEQGYIMFSHKLQKNDAKCLGLTSDIHIKVTEKHQHYLQYHRRHVFQ